MLFTSQEGQRSAAFSSQSAAPGALVQHHHPVSALDNTGYLQGGRFQQFTVHCWCSLCTRLYRCALQPGAANAVSLVALIWLWLIAAVLLQNICMTWPVGALRHAQFPFPLHICTSVQVP